MKITQDKVFYHIYPLGMCGAPLRNDFQSPAGDGLKKLIDRIPHFLWLGINAVYIGPLFESTAHGYDTVDYFHVDRRLGTNADLVELVRALHANGIAVILDAVFNHTGRDFFAFKDILQNGESSQYKDWYKHIDFNRRSPAGDSFSYEGWSGNYDLVKLDTENPEVRKHLLDAVHLWISEFDIDGLRLDAADQLSPEFMDALSTFCRREKPDFWLAGEVVHGDYRHWAHRGRFDSVTNYETYKGLWSSFNDRNMFEIAWSLNRQFGPDGMYRDIPLYNFVDNHDVSRLASILKNPAHLIPVYAMLFTIPGIPSIYYGSEWGLRGEKRPGSDAELRPCVRETAEHGRYSGVPVQCQPQVDSAALESAIHRLAGIRKVHQALQSGSYAQLHVASESFAFLRGNTAETMLIVVNAASQETKLRINLPAGKQSGTTMWKELFIDEQIFHSERNLLSVSVPAFSVRICQEIFS